MYPNALTTEGWEIIYAGRANVRRGVHSMGVPDLANLPPGSYLSILICEAGGGLYFDPRLPAASRKLRAILPGEGLLAWRNAWLMDLTGEEYRLLGLVLRAPADSSFAPLVEGALRKNSAEHSSLPVLDSACVRRLRLHLEEMDWEYRQKNLGWHGALRGRFDLLQTEVARWAQDGVAADARDRNESPEVRKARAFFEARMPERISLDAVARAAGLSPKSLIAHFQAAGLGSPMRFLSDLRLRKARELLHEQGRRVRVKEVAAAVGLAPGAFGRAYRRRFEQSPRSDRILKGAREAAL